MILLQVALLAEAKPLIEYFGLKQIEKKGFSIWAGSNMQLVLSGVGKQNAAMATSYLAGREEGIGFLNVGICGHSHWDVGEGFLAHQIKDGKRIFYPTFSFDWKDKTDCLFCVEDVELNYEDKGGYDMESAGFFQAASKFISLEQIHSYKVISDHPDSPTHFVTRKRVHELMTAHLQKLDSVIEKMREMGKKKKERQVEIDPDGYYDQTHFTQAQKNRFEDLLKRATAMGVAVDIEGNAQEMIHQMETFIREY